MRDYVSNLRNWRWSYRDFGEEKRTETRIGAVPSVDRQNRRRLKPVLTILNRNEDQDTADSIRESIKRTDFPSAYRDYDGGESTEAQQKFAWWANRKALFKTCTQGEYKGELKWTYNRQSCGNRSFFPLNKKEHKMGEILYAGHPSWI